MTFLARKEPFGGILAKMGSEEILLLDQFSFDIVQAIANGYSQFQVDKEIENRFPPEDIERAKSRSRDVFAVLDGTLDPKNLKISLPMKERRFPALSAPLDLYWEITRRCNERCIQCYNNSSPEGFNLHIDHIRGVIDELKPFKLRNLTLTGGEPMMRRDFWEIVSEVRSICRELTLGTNATLINRSNIDRVEEYIEYSM